MAALMVKAKFPWSQTVLRATAAVRPRWRSAPSLVLPRAAATSDAELVSRHLAGDPRAFAELVKRYTRAIYNVTYRYTGDAAEAENLTQETFLRAWNALPRVGLDRPLKPYLVKIAVNLCRDWAARRPATVVPLEDENQSDLPDDDGDPWHAVNAQELRERVRAELDALPPLDRMVLALRYSEEMSYEEIAAALDMPVNTVRTQLFRAKAKLRALLKSGNQAL